MRGRNFPTFAYEQTSCCLERLNTKVHSCEHMASCDFYGSALSACVLNMQLGSVKLSFPVGIDRDCLSLVHSLQAHTRHARHRHLSHTLHVYLFMRTQPAPSL